MTRIEAAGSAIRRVVVALSALGVFVIVLAMTTHASVLKSAAGTGNGDFDALANVAENLTTEAVIPVILLAPLAAVAGGFMMLIGGGGQRGSGGAKLIAGAIGAVVVVIGARGLAA